MRYTYCGCPVPGATIGQRLSKLIIHHSLPDSPPNGFQHQLTPPVSTQSGRASMHPSDHDAVLNLGQGESYINQIKRARSQVAERRRKQDERTTKKQTNEDAAWGYAPHNGPHQMAFLVPVPVTSTTATACVGSHLHFSTVCAPGLCRKRMR